MLRKFLFAHFCQLKNRLEGSGINLLMIGNYRADAVFTQHYMTSSLPYDFEPEFIAKNFDALASGNRLKLVQLQPPQK